MKTWIAALAIASVLTVQSAAVGGTVGDMTLKEYREHNEAAQLYMVFGAWALADTVGVKCTHIVTMREWRAGLLRPDLNVMQPWVKALGMLMDERGCRVEQAKGDT